MVLGLGLVLDHLDLGGAAVRHDFAGNGLVEHGRPDLDLGALFVGHEQGLKRHGLANLNVKLFNLDDIAFLDEILLPAGLDDCKHSVGIIG